MYLGTAKVSLMGILGKESSFEPQESGILMCVIYANHIRVKQNGEKKFYSYGHRVAFSKKHAERAKLYLKQGSLILLEGFLQTEKILDKEDQTRFTTTIFAHTFFVYDRHDTQAVYSFDE